MPFEIVAKGSRTETVEPINAPPLPPQLPAQSAELKEALNEVTSLKTRVAELETQLEGEKKERAELMGLKGRQQGQIMQLNRSLEKEKGEVRKLTVELTSLRERLEVPPSSGDGVPSGSNGESTPIPAEGTEEVKLDATN